MHQFKIGDIVRHAATKQYDGLRMIVTALGSLDYGHWQVRIYSVSAERPQIGRQVGDPTHFSTLLSEAELTLCEE